MLRVGCEPRMIARDTIAEPLDAHQRETRGERRVPRRKSRPVGARRGATPAEVVDGAARTVLGNDLYAELASELDEAAMLGADPACTQVNRHAADRFGEHLAPDPVAGALSDPAPERADWAVPSAIAPSPGDGEVDEVLADLKDAEPLPTAGEPVLAPDRRTAAAVLAARPPGTAVGYLLIDLESGQELAELNPDLPLIPASTAKLATAVVALDVLGPDHRYRTELLARGTIEGGVLHGDLILRGGGDPSLDLADLLGLAVRLETAGVRYVDGRFLVDDSALPVLSEIEPTQPPEAAYNPGIGALSLAFNRVRVAWRGGGEITAAAMPPLSFP